MNVLGMSPRQIRTKAAAMVRTRVRRELDAMPRPLRDPEYDETPLSVHEQMFALRHGLIRPKLWSRDAEGST